MAAPPEDGVEAAFVGSRRWELTATLTAGDGEPDDSFGQSISLWGDRALIGTHVSGGEGSAYLFEYDGEL